MGRAKENQRLTEELAATRDALRQVNRSEPLPDGISFPRTFVRAKIDAGNPAALHRGRFLFGVFAVSSEP
jgi:hypothetical protein